MIRLDPVRRSVGGRVAAWAVRRGVSFITGDQTSADVVALETLWYVSWSKDSLRSLLEERPQLKVALQFAISVDLIGKQRRRDEA